MSNLSRVFHQCRSVIAALGCCALMSCGHHVPAPVVNLSYDYSPNSRQPTESSDNIPEFHIVERGDTLYSIAWRYGVDYRYLATLNNIDNDYRIYPGQKLSFAVQQISGGRDTFDEEKLKLAVFQALKLPIQDQKSLESAKSNDSKVRVHSRQRPNKTTASVNSSQNLKKSARQPPIASGNAQSTGAKVARWHWPIRGPIIDRFSGNLYGNKGVDISGKHGQAVRAAAQGRVVYRGNALKGYGNLIIVKHNDDFLSAYAHNSKIHVKENEIVKAGQVIADIGSSGTDQSKLHFEIRYRGKPVDPIKYLPKL